MVFEPYGFANGFLDCLDCLKVRGWLRDCAAKVPENLAKYDQRILGLDRTWPFLGRMFGIHQEVD